MLAKENSALLAANAKAAQEISALQHSHLAVQNAQLVAELDSLRASGVPIALFAMKRRRRRE